MIINANIVVIKRCIQIFDVFFFIVSWNLKNDLLR